MSVVTVAETRPQLDPVIEERLRGLPRPAPVVDPARTRLLTERQREILNQLTVLFDEGFADVTMATLAKRLNCSLRTLYALAPSRDELVLAIVDLRLRRIGGEARAALTEDMTPLEVLRAYLHGTTVALMGASDEFARDVMAVPTVNDLIDVHNDYLFAVTRILIELAVEQGEMPPVDIPAFARVLAGLGWGLTRPEIKPLLATSPKEAADSIVDVIIRGLQSSTEKR